LKDERRWLTIWLIEVPDIHVGFCTDLYPDRPKGDKDDSVIISTQMMFSGARYAIQHPGSKSDDVGQYLAGMEGSLRTYEALVAQKPKDRQPALDDLLTKREAGRLRQGAGCGALQEIEGTSYGERAIDRSMETA
jgi:hypothetical protein